MSRARSVLATKRRHKRFLKAAKGYFGGRSKQYRVARQTVERAWAFATAHRRLKKRDFRTLWIARISAAVRANGLTYSRFMNALRRGNIQLNRKSLSELAQTDKEAFAQLIQVAKAADVPAENVKEAATHG